MRGYSEQKDQHLRRLRRIEGQVRGLQRMIENDEYCIDVLTQISAATRALQSVSIALIDEHLKHCVRAAVAEGAQAEASGDPHATAAVDAKIQEASEAIARLVRS